jgi:hypothetical protein
MATIARVLLMTTSFLLLFVPRAVQAQTPEFSLPPSIPNYGRVGIGQRLHGGAFIDPSPVGAPSQSSFRAVDLTGLSGGVSLGSGSLTASLGSRPRGGRRPSSRSGPHWVGSPALLT